MPVKSKTIERCWDSITRAPSMDDKSDLIRWCSAYIQGTEDITNDDSSADGASFANAARNFFLNYLIFLKDRQPLRSTTVWAVKFSSYDGCDCFVSLLEVFATEELAIAYKDYLELLSLYFQDLCTIETNLHERSNRKKSLGIVLPSDILAEARKQGIPESVFAYSSSLQLFLHLEDPDVPLVHNKNDHYHVEALDVLNQQPASVDLSLTMVQES